MLNPGPDVQNIRMRPVRECEGSPSGAKTWSMASHVMVFIKIYCNYLCTFLDIGLTTRHELDRMAADVALPRVFTGSIQPTARLRRTHPSLYENTLHFALTA